MAKKLRDIVPNQKNSEGISSDIEGEKKFAAAHKGEVIDDVNGNGDEVFKASKVKTFDRSAHHYGVPAGATPVEHNKPFSPVSSIAQTAVGEETKITARKVD